MAWAPDYVTSDDLASYIRIDDTDDDAELTSAATTGARAIDNATNRQFGKVDEPELRRYRARPDYSGHGYWVVDVDDFHTTAGLVVTVDGTVVTAAGYEPAPVNSAALGRPWWRIAFTADAEAYPDTHPHTVDVVAAWGWADVPPAVIAANLLQGARFFKRRDAPFGVAGSPDQGSEMRLLARVDPDVYVALGPYRRARPPQ